VLVADYNAMVGDGIDLALLLRGGGDGPVFRNATRPAAGARQ
jgi:hypothetical protein